MIHESDLDELDPLPDDFYMRKAIEEAKQALEEDEVPVGAVIVLGSRVIASAHNQREQLKDPTAHAEILAITQATQAIDDWRLEHCTMYVTLEPCIMCAGAIIQSRIPKVVFGASDPKAGGVQSMYELLSDSRLNHRAEISGGLFADECGMLLTHFFQEKRRQGKK
ncbi:MAG: tRNA adenosine(34) deaminase TadA [Pirellulaceae bacterium]